VERPKSTCRNEQRENDGTGLYAYRARFFSPVLHRFISEDPIGFEGGDINLYAYVLNAPTMLRDPSGQVPFRSAPGCELPRDKKDRPLKRPPFAWLIRCVPTVVPDLVPPVPDLSIDGPRGTRIFQLRLDGMPAIRLDYGPYPGTGGQPSLHLHLPMIWPDWHTPLNPTQWW